MIFWWLWFSFLLIKIIILPFIPITPDEAYYFAWGQHLQLSYFDHPPFVSYLMYLGSFFWQTPLTARFPGVLVSHLTLIPWYFILKHLNFTKSQKLIWLCLVLVSPLVGIGSFLVTPDAPLLFFWSISLLVFLKLHQNLKSVGIWVLLGALIGLGMLSKYMMVLFPLAMVILFINEKKYDLFLKPQAWICLLVGILFFSPVIIWNIQNKFASFGFQASHGLSSYSFNIKSTLEYVLGQWALLNPIIASVLIFNVKKLSKQNSILFIFSLTPLFFFLFTSLKGHVEPNWPVAAHPGLIAMAVLVSQKVYQQKWLKGALLLSLAFYIFVIFNAISPLKVFKNAHSKVLHQWQADIEILKNYHPLYARSYQLAGYHSFFREQNKEVFKLKGFDRKDFYDFLDVQITQIPSYIVLHSDDLTPATFNEKYSLKVLQSLPSGLVVYEITAKAL